MYLSHPAWKISSSFDTGYLKTFPTTLRVKSIHSSSSHILGGSISGCEDSSTAAYTCLISASYRSSTVLRLGVPLFVYSKGLDGLETNIISLNIWECVGERSLACSTYGLYKS